MSEVWARCPKLGHAHLANEGKYSVKLKISFEFWKVDYNASLLICPCTIQRYVTEVSGDTFN